MTRTKFDLRAVLLHPAFITAALVFIYWAVRYWPVPVNLGSVQPSGPGDGWGGTAVWQALVGERLNPFAPGDIASYNAPDGFPIPWQVNLQQWPTTLFYYGATRVTGDADVAHNLYMLTGLVGTATSMAWLVWRFVVQDRWIAVLGGLALVLQPLLIIKAPGHTAFAHMWPIVLTIGLVLLAAERPSWKRGVAAGAMAFVAVSWSGYHLILAGAAFGTVVIGVALANWRKEDRGKIWKALAVSVATLVFCLGVLAAALLVAGRGADPTDAVRAHSIDTLTVYGARFHEYFVPPPTSELFGSITDDWLKTRMHGSNGAEASLYQGAVVMLLALAGLAFLLFRRLRGSASWLRSSATTLAVIGPVLAIAAVYWSLPPHIYPVGLKIPTPSLAAFQFVTTWRVYSRFALVVAIGVIVLAAIGLRWAAGSTSRVRYVAVLAVATILIPLDLSVSSSGPVATDAPQVASVIAKLPPGIVAVYPLERGEADGYGQFYNQQYYKHPVFNGFDDLPEESRASRLTDITKEQTVDDLAAIGVRFVAIIRRPLATALDEPPIAGQAKSLIPRGSGMYGNYTTDLFEIPANRRSVVATQGKGFGGPEGAPGEQVTWATGADAAIDVRADCDSACSGTLKMDVLANGPERTVTVKVAGKPVEVRLRGTRSPGAFKVRDWVPVSVPLSVTHHTSVALSSSPGAIPVNQIDPSNPDPRSLSIAVRNVRWVPAAVPARR